MTARCSDSNRTQGASSSLNQLDTLDLDQETAVSVVCRAMTTDTSERGLERLICTALTGRPLRSAGKADHR